MSTDIDSWLIYSQETPMSGWLGPLGRWHQTSCSDPTTKFEHTSCHWEEDVDAVRNGETPCFWLPTAPRPPDRPQSCS